jgi:excisionase family DNA binding protein
MKEDERYVRELDYEQDKWALSGQQWYTVTQVAEHLGLSDESIRKLAEMGKFPGAVLHGVKRIGWRIPREGAIGYLAELHREADRRRKGGTAG